MTIIILIALGSLTGVLAGYLGIGGGVILVPVLTEIFLNRGLDLDHTMTAAFATSLMTAIFTTGSAAIRQWRQNNLFPQAIPITAAGAVLGGQLGAWLGSRLSGGVLIVLFSMFLLFSAFNLWRGSKSNSVDEREQKYGKGLFVLGLITGVMAALFGVGGGILMVPAFILIFHFSPGKVAGTSSAIACLIGISGVIGYLLYGSGRAVDLAGFIGVIDLRVGIPIAIGSVLTAPFGAMLNKKFGGAVYQKIFAVFLAIIAIRMLIRGII